MADAVINVGLGSLCMVLAIFGPWRRSSWWPARMLFGIVAFNVALGVVTLRAWL